MSSLLSIVLNKDVVSTCREFCFANADVNAVLMCWKNKKIFL